MSQPRAPRRFLGKSLTFAERVRTYWTDEALEVDQADHFEIRRRRVFFDEIQLVTLHLRRLPGSGLLPLILALVSALIAAASSSEPDVSQVFWIGAALLGGLSVVLGALPVWVVTVYGKRARSRMHFRMRQGKARSVYADVCRAASDAQRALSLRLAVQAPEPPLPQPPP